MRRLPLIAVLLAATACEDPGSPEPVPAGEMSAALSGAYSERYQVEGSEPARAGEEPVTFASARPGTIPGLVLVGGFRARGAAQDMLTLELREGDGPGGYALTDGAFVYGRPDAPSDRAFRITSGEVTVHSASRDWLQGTFHATAVELVVPVGGLVADTLHISDGSFSVPIVDPYP